MPGESIPNLPGPPSYKQKTLTITQETSKNPDHNTRNEHRKTLNGGKEEKYEKQKILGASELEKQRSAEPPGFPRHLPLIQLKGCGKSLQLKTTNSDRQKKNQKPPRKVSRIPPHPRPKKNDCENGSPTTENNLDNPQLTTAKCQWKTHTRPCPSPPLKF